MKTKKVLITTGDPDGIGLEVTLKALAKIGPQKNVCFFFFRYPDSEKKYFSLLRNKFNVLSAVSFEEALSLPIEKKTIVEIFSEKNAAIDFEDSVRAALEKNLDAIVTAPLSKELIANSGLSDRGHTDIIRRLSGKKNIYMSFVGERFSLMLATDHVPYKDVPQKISQDLLLNLFLSTKSFFDLLKIPRAKRKIGVLGLNPHAGEIKNLGQEDLQIILPAIVRARAEGLNVTGPLVPDVAFQPNNYKKFPLFVAMYHDQGLIPFKILHKKNHGVQLSLGAPFVRTSVDHGTAKDIFGKNRADAGSMIRAIQMAIKIV